MSDKPFFATTYSQHHREIVQCVRPLVSDQERQLATHDRVGSVVGLVAGLAQTDDVGPDVIPAVLAEDDVVKVQAL